jgi:hypothetical protein
MTCILCGTRYGLEWRPVEVIREQVAARYREGPFAWKYLKDASDALFCMHCLNHMRKRRNISRKNMLPADHYLLGLLSPGLLEQLDTRSRKRLDRVMAELNNPFRYTGLEPLRLMMGSDHLHTWWDINLKCEFFHDRTTAKMIRQKIKDR